MRHAKSSWKTGAQTDHERPLNKRGRRDAPRVAAYLQQADWVPDAVLSSDSARTTETWMRMADVIGGRPVRFTRELYHASVLAFCREVGGADPSITTQLVLGHNPGWEEVVHWLSDAAVGMTTANAALLEGRGETWHHALQPGAWSLQAVVRPKEIG